MSNTINLIQNDNTFSIDISILGLANKNVAIDKSNPLAATVAIPSYLSQSQRNELQDYLSSNIKSVSGENINNQLSLQDYMQKSIKNWLADNQNKMSSDVSIANRTSDILNVGQPNVYGRNNVTVNDNVNIGNQTAKYGQAEEFLRENELIKKQTLLDPKSKQMIGTSNGGTLVDTLSGSDLSVFFVVELPKLSDVTDSQLANSPHLWQKELMILEIDSVLSATYSIMREVFPVRSIGKSKPKSFVRGPVTVSGSMAFTIFTDDVLVRLRTQLQQSISDLKNKTQNALRANKANIDKYNKNNTSQTENQIKKLQDQLKELEAYAETDESLNDADYIRDDIDKVKAQIKLTQDQLKLDQQKNLNITELPSTSITDTYATYNRLLNLGGVFMLNQLLPFHILVMGTTERGTFAKMMFKNIRVIDENQMQGVQQPNIVNRISFVAEDIFPLTSGTVATNLSFDSVASYDQDRAGSNQFGIYKGSQIMKDVSAMAEGEYRLKV